MHDADVITSRMINEPDERNLKPFWDGKNSCTFDGSYIAPIIIATSIQRKKSMAQSDYCE